MNNLISREAALDAGKELCETCDEQPNGWCGSCRMDEYLKAIEALPPTPAQRWIPCKEQMPEEGINVLCCSLAGVMFVASYGKLHKFSEEKGWITDTIMRFSKEFVEWWTTIPEPPVGVMRGEYGQC